MSMGHCFANNDAVNRIPYTDVTGGMVREIKKKLGKLERSMNHV
jgi:isopentenyl phosphate kinase